MESGEMKYGRNKVMKGTGLCEKQGIMGIIGSHEWNRIVGETGSMGETGSDKKNSIVGKTRKYGWYRKS